MVLFDIRTDDSHVGFIAAVNRYLDIEPGNPYLARFGHVCSPRWWVCLDRGEMPVEVLAGPVTLVGARSEPWSDGPEDVVEFRCGEQIIVYDQVGFWATVPVRVGDRVSVTRTVAELQTRTGLIRSLIDLRGEWLPSGATPTAHRRPHPRTLGRPAGREEEVNLLRRMPESHAFRTGSRKKRHGLCSPTADILLASSA